MTEDRRKQWVERRDNAKALWKGGGSFRQIAATLRVSDQRARNVVQEWILEEDPTLFLRAVRALTREGLDEEQIMVFIGSGRYLIQRMIKYLADEPNSGANPHVSLLGLPVRAENTLYNLGAETLDDAAKLSESQMRAVGNCGETTVRQIREALAIHGRSLSP